MFSLIYFLITGAAASDIQEKGFVLKEKSYVMTIQESENLKEYIFELEKKEKILDKYMLIEEKMLKNEELYLERLKLKDEQIIQYKNLLEIQKESAKLEKRKIYKNIGLFSLGILFSGSTIYLTSQVI